MIPPLISFPLPHAGLFIAAVRPSLYPTFDLTMDSSGQPSDAAPSPASNSARPIPPPSGASPSVDSASPPKIEDRNLIPVPSYAWITGNNPALVHLRKIASGGFGHVHEVVLYIKTLKRLLIDLGERYKYWKCIVQTDIS